MNTLIAVGTGTASVYSTIAIVFPGIFPEPTPEPLILGAVYYQNSVILKIQPFLSQNTVFNALTSLDNLVMWVQIQNEKDYLKWVKAMDVYGLPAPAAAKSKESDQYQKGHILNDTTQLRHGIFPFHFSPLEMKLCAQMAKYFRGHHFSAYL